MAEYFLSKEQLNEQRKDQTKFFSKLTESKTAHQRSALSNEVTIFLSHKHSDVEVLENVISMLKNLGVSVYVDWMDEDMPKYTSGTTAIKIKQKIRNCKKFILLATEGAIASKWCNWELGYGDAHKYSDHIAIMPIIDTRGGTFSGNEYLQIYPIIKSEYQYTSGGYYVEFGSSKTKLEDWLKK